MKRAGTVALAVAVVVLVARPAGAGESATTAEVRSLAAAARHDAAALERLRSVDRVDGRAVDVGAALAGAEGPTLARRLAALAAEGPSPTEPAAARRQAARILEGSEYRARRPPRPLRGILTWIGARLQPLGRPFAAVGRFVMQGGWLSLLLSTGVVAAAAIAAAVVIQRRGIVVEGAGGGGRAPRRGDDPAELDRLADKAEVGGDLEQALRLRFTAGLLRLDQAGALRYRPSLTTGAVTRQVPSPVLRQLAMTLDEVVYGRRPASPDDMADARRRWPEVLTEVRA